MDLKSDAEVAFTFRLPFVVNAFWHTLQTNGREPVCVRKWMWRAELELKFLRQTRHKCLEFVDCWLSLDDWLVDAEAMTDSSSGYDVLLDWVDGECSGNEVGELLSDDFLEWNRELGMVSDNGIVGFNCVASENLNYVKLFTLPSHTRSTKSYFGNFANDAAHPHVRTYFVSVSNSPQPVDLTANLRHCRGPPHCH